MLRNLLFSLVLAVFCAKKCNKFCQKHGGRCPKSVKHLSNRKHSMVEKVVTKAGKDCRVCSNKYREPGLAILAYGKLKLKKGNFRKFNECKKKSVPFNTCIVKVCDFMIFHMSLRCVAATA